MQEYTKTFEFGKIDAENHGRKDNLVDLEVTLAIKDKKPVFSVVGNVWNRTHRDIIMGGQCIDDIYNDYKSEIKNRKTYETIMALWEKWHLNDMNAGCEHQRAEHWGNESINEPCPICGYRYGSAWLYRAIDKKDLIEICRLLEIDQREVSRIIRGAK